MKSLVYTRKISAPSTRCLGPRRPLRIPQTIHRSPHPVYRISRDLHIVKSEVQKEEVETFEETQENEEDEGEDDEGEDLEDDEELEAQEVEYEWDNSVASITFEELKKINILSPHPGYLQQTLWRSFTIGGIGLHSGELAFVRVRPALAGEGRYFVRVPEGTNRDLDTMFQVDLVEIYPEPQLDLDVDQEVMRTNLFLKYLDYREKEGYVGEFSEFLDEYGRLNGILFEDEEELAPQEEPVPRSDTNPADVIPATLEYLSKEDALYNTTLVNERGTRVESVEHLLAALEACGIDNARIEIEGGPEVPTVDGSSLGWATEIYQSGVTTATCGEDGEDTFIRAALKPEEIIRVQEGDAFIVLIPGDKMQITYGIDHRKECPYIGSQWFSWCLQEETDFKVNVSAAKTYVTSKQEVHDMYSQGFMRAGSEGVMIIGDGEDILDETVLTYGEEEPVRHKVLDLIGDLALLGEEGMGGLPFGHIIAYKANHKMHHDFAKVLSEKYKDQYLQFDAPTEEELSAPDASDIKEEEDQD